TSTGNMKITIDRDGASKGTIRRINAAVWEADGVTQVACKRYINDNDVIVIEIVGTLVDGNQYYLSVDNNYSGYRGSFTLCLDDTDAGISYDYYEGAIEIADIHNWCSAEGEYTTYGATPDKNAGSCWNTSPNYNVWFKFVATQPYINIEAITSTAGNTVRRLNVALWEADGVTPVSCNRYISDNDDVSVGSTTLTPTNTYYISVDNNYSGYRGSFKLCVTDDAAYNYYEGAVELTDLNNWCSADAEFTTSGADGDKSAASCWNTSPNYNRWFKFTAISPNATISVNRGSLGTIRRINLALWQSDGTTEVACNRYSSDNDDVSISVGSLVIGNDYYISVDNNYSGYRGSFMLCVSNVDQTYYSRQSGSWTDPNTWSTVGYGGTAASDYPKVGDVANIEDNTITITTNEVAAEVNISTSANNTGLTVSNGSLDVSGNFVVTNPGNNFNHAFTFNNSTIHVDNDFIINKNGGNANISIGISTLANFTIDNDFVFNSTAGTGNNTISISVLSNFTVGNNLILSNTGGPKTTLTIDNSNATITSNLNFIASADNKNEIDLVNSGNLHLKGSVDRGTPAYGILSSAAGTTVYFDSNDNLQIFPHSTGSGTGDTFTYQNVNINNTRITSPQLTLNGAVTVNGTLTLVDGQLLSTASKLLTIAAGGAITGASISSFINGPVRKIGNTDFEFPVGDDNFWQPISITNLTGDAATEFTAEYFVQTPPDFKTLEIPDLSGNGDLNNISGSEYWNLSNTGTASDADVTLFWKDQARSEIDNAADLQIAHYNGTHWENLGQSSINFSDPGSITVTGVSSFSPLTFGSESSSSNPLPVELTSLEAFVTSNSVIIKWSTASEVNNDHFVIERSHDGLEFKKIGTIQGNGSTTELNKYQFEDHSPIIGSSYYRLKQVDFDGKSQDSNLLSVNFDQLKYSIFPNPITNGELNLQIVSGATGYGYLTLINALGQTAMTEEYAFEPMTYQNLHIGVNKLPKGIYILKMQIDNKILKERVIIK
ncbi:MAG TPA: T9SS type A sorting domain-containing protein, partial [Fulvivirga sp.]|nr:T9SS type A sorting domain-containing protein [Fulvivirga sp.]